MLVGSTGCVRRRMTIRSNPPGATVYVDDREIGKTPVSTSHVYYGTRTFRLEREGYEIATQKQKLTFPWYQIPPLDFFAENLWPHEIRDERVLDFEMIPLQTVEPNEVVNRGQNLRDNARNGNAIPLLASPPGAIAPAAANVTIPGR